MLLLKINPGQEENFVQKKKKKICSKERANGCHKDHNICRVDYTPKGGSVSEKRGKMARCVLEVHSRLPDEVENTVL